MKMKKCIGSCGRELEENEDNFYFRKDQQKFRLDCKICFNKKRKEFRDKNIEIVRARKKAAYYANHEENKAKNRAEYNEKKNDPEYLAMRKERSRKYKEKDPEGYAARRRIIRKRYEQKNKEKIKARRKERLKEDPAYKLRCKISCAVWKGLNSRGLSKDNKATWAHLPYTPQELKKHIESLFEPWMNWDNWSIYDPSTWDDNDPSTWTWQLDHIQPQSDFNITSMDSEEFRACWALSNLRPLSAKENTLDGSTRKRHNKKKK